MSFIPPPQRKRMKAQVFLWMGFLTILTACDQYTERDVLATGNKKTSTAAKASNKKRDAATFNVKAPRTEDANPEARESNAATMDKNSKEKNSTPVVVCDRIEQSIQLPSLKDPCVIGVDQIQDGKYTLRRVDIEVQQAETKEVLRFSREAKAAGRFQMEDVMRRDVLWGASNEVSADLNLSWNLWKTATGVKFDNRVHHTVVFDRLKNRVVSKNLVGQNDLGVNESELGSRMYEIFTQTPQKDAKTKESIKLMSGDVTHKDATIFEPNTNHAVRWDRPYNVKGQGLVRRVGKDDSSIQLIVTYQLKGGNGLNYIYGVAYEYVLTEKLAQFKGLAGD